MFYHKHFIYHCKHFIKKILSSVQYFKYNHISGIILKLLDGL